MKKSEIMKSILYAVGVTGVIAVSLAVPNLPAALMSAYSPLRRYKQGQVRRGFDYIKSRRLIGIGQEKGKTLIKLTEAGQNRLLKFRLDDIRINKPRKWDGKWRVVMFDIPEQFKLARQVLSRKLRELGFEQLQKSVWIHPYPCQDEIDFVAAVYEVSRFVKMLTVDASQMERRWQKRFNLI